MPERRLIGEAASPGLAMGPVLRLADLMASQSVTLTGTPEAERQRLAEAMTRAARDLERLAAASGANAAAVFEFQTEMLSDPALIEDALVAVQAGTPARDAWRNALDAQILAYTQAEDDYFRARSADLADLRDRVLVQLSGEMPAVAPAETGAIVLARDIGPSRFLGLDWSQLRGVALEAGSRTSHVAMLARARGIPMVTGLGDVFEAAGEAILDGAAGALILDPEPSTREVFERRRADEVKAAAIQRKAVGPALTKTRDRVHVLLNVDDPAALEPALLAASDGIGLARSEFLFLGRDDLPDESTQYEAYADLVRRAGGKPVTVRTLDIGGDKSLPGLSLPPETNPFLGLRGIRLCLDRRDLFVPQLRALLRAAALGPLKIMLPMIAHPDELAESMALLAAALGDLQAAGIAAAMPPLGIMIEVPSAAITIERFADAAFFSIGSNDLTQYVMAASRDASGRVARLADPTDPAVLLLIDHVAAHGREVAKEVSVCGDMASDPRGLAALLELGIRRVSVAPAAFEQVRATIATYG